MVPNLPELVAHLAINGQAAQRLVLAEAAGQMPEILFLLAADAEEGVRDAVARNAAAPARADSLLARDASVRVRIALARKLGPRAAELFNSVNECKRLQISREALLTLARDVEAMVRTAVADALADLPDAPRELVLELARDAALEVCEPLIRLSNVLGESDLLELAERPPGPQTRLAVAGRLHLPEAVGLALLRAGEPEAIRALLRNGTARLPGEVLASLARDVGTLPWLPEALAARPALPPPALETLLPRLTADAIARLLQRPDLPAAAVARLRARAAMPAPKPNRASMVWGD